MDLGSGEENETDQLSMEITPETLYTVIGVCAGGLLAIVLLILTAIYCRRLTLQVVCTFIWMIIYKVLYFQVYFHFE